MHVTPCAGMRKTQCLSMKGKTVQTAYMPSVFYIPHNRMAHIGGMHPDLVFPPRIQLELHKSGGAVTFQYPETSNSRLSVAIIIGIYLKGTVLFQKASDNAFVFLHIPFNKSHIFS